MARETAETSAPVEHVEKLVCPEGHDVEVHWTDGQKAECWQCPTCLVTFHAEEIAKVDPRGAPPEQLNDQIQAAGARAHERSLVPFGDG